MLASLVAIAYFVVKYSLWPYQVATHHFMMRDYIRTQDLLNGQLIWYGPELNLGGYLPGPFFYYLLSIPLALSTQVESIVLSSYLLSALAAGILFYALYRTTNPLSAIFGALLYFTSVTISEELYRLWNPTFTLIFNVGISCLLLQSFLRKEVRSLYIATFLMGLAIQIHLSVGLHWLTIIAFSLVAPLELNLVSLLKKMALAFFIFLIPMIPYFIWLYLSGEINLFSISAHSNVHTFASGWMLDEVIWSNLDIQPWALVSVVALSVVSFIKKIKMPLICHLTLIAFLTHLVFTFAFLSIKTRYLLVFQTYSILFFSVFLGWLFEIAKSVWNWQRLTLILVTSTLCFWSLGSYLKQERNNYIEARLMPSYFVGDVRKGYWRHLLHDYIEIAKLTLKETNWSATEFEDRVFHFVGNSFEIGSLYRTLGDRDEQANSETSYDGMIIYPFVERFSGSDFEWFNEIGVPKHIIDFFKAAHIVNRRTFHNLRVIYYKLSPEQSPEMIPHNMGLTFAPRSIEKAINAVKVDQQTQSAIASINKQKDALIWDFGGHFSYQRRIAILLSFQQENQNEMKVNLDLQSHILRLTFPNQDNFFDQVFVGGLKVRLKGVKNVREVAFPRHLGDPYIPIEEVESKYQGSNFKYNHHGKGFVAQVTPITRHLLWPCSDVVEQIEIEIEDLVIMRNRSKFVESHQQNILKQFPYSMSCDGDRAK